MRYVFLIIFMGLIGCEKMPDHCKEGYSVIQSHMRDMESSHGWFGEAVGGSFYGGDVKMLKAEFFIITPTEKFDIDLARQKIVDGSEIFLKTINNKDTLKPHLNQLPFTAGNIKYGVSFYTPDGAWLGYVFLRNGDLVYFEKDQDRNLQEIHREPYEVALEKVGSGLLKVSPSVICEQ